MAQDTRGEFRFELVVVDNNSSDETPRVLEEIKASATIPFRAVRELRAGVACARNRGIREAAGSWIAFFDDDQIADPTWLRELLSFARAKEARCIGGANRLLYPPGVESHLPPICRSLLGETVGRDVPCRYDRNLAPGTGNLLLHRSVLDEVGDFNECLREAGEDADLFRRIWTARIESWYTPRAISYHVVPAYRLRPEYFRWKCLRNGGHLARRNRQHWGSVLSVAALAARVGQAMALHLPRLLWALFRGADEDALSARCLLWRAEGYARFALFLLAPGVFRQRAIFDSLEFRAERDLFTQTRGERQRPEVLSSP
jgi:glycosyltransferase involved in cell wall biosynthesis